MTLSQYATFICTRVNQTVILFAALSIVAGQARGAISLTTGNIAYNSGSSGVGTSGAITISPAMAAGDVIILSVVGSGMIDASGTNIEFALLAKAGSSSTCEAVFIGRATGAASSFTVNQTTTTSGLSVVGAVFTSTNRLIVDVSQVGTASSTSLASGATATTTTADELWIGAGGIRNVSGATFSSQQINSVNADNSYSTATTIGTTNDRAACFFYRIVSGTGTPSATATSSGTGIHVTFCVTFKEVSSGGGTTVVIPIQE